MYILELITKYIKGKKYKIVSDYSPEKAEDITEKPDECRHLFQPLDSTGEYLGCKFCGLVIKNTTNK